MTGPQCPQQTRLAEYATGKLPEPEASSIAQHLEQCGDCEATIQRLEAASDTFVAGLKAEAPVAEPYTDEAPYRRAAEQAAQLSATTTPPSPPAGAAAQPAASSPPSPLAGEGPGVRGAAAEGSSPPVPSSAPSSGLRPPSPVAGAGVRPAAPVEKSVTKGTSKLGPYQLLAKLGEGGMGAVYKARHEHLEKIVAIKILPKKAMQDAAAVARFRREMKVVGALHHPNIVGAHDAGEALGVHYLVMEYVAGSDLSSLLKKQGPLPLDRAISYTRQAARGLAFAHAKGVIHRDIKPANLLVDGEGTLKILDLGLARLDDGDLHNAAAREGLTQTGQVMGTVDYMAPEQAFDTHRADAKADVYSLGCSLYRLLTGQNVFGGDTVVQKILAHREQPIPSLRVARPDVSPRLDALYQRMIAKRPEDRPTMAEIAGELEALERGVAEAPIESIVIDTSKAASPERKRRDASRAAGSARPAPTAPSPVRGPRASAPRGPGRRPPAWLLAAAAGGAALVVCLGVWIIVRDPQGNEIARLQAPDGSSVTVQPHAPQPHEPRPSGSGFVATPPSPLAGEGPAATGATPPPPALNPATIDFAAHRAEAEWLLDAGANYLKIAPPHDLPAETTVKQLADLPQEPFVLTFISFRHSMKRLPDEAHYRSWAKLTSLRGFNILSGPTLTDRAVAELVTLPRLDFFGIYGPTNVTNEGLRAIARSKTLRGLDFHSSPQFNEDSLAILEPLTKLNWLNVRGCPLGESGFHGVTRFENLETLIIEPRLSTGLGQLKALPRLSYLDLNGPFVTDAALQELAGVTSLKNVVLTQTQVTPAALAAFRKATGAEVVFAGSADASLAVIPPAPLSAAGPAATGAVPPPLAVAPFDAKEARTHQEAWARHLGMTIESTNSVGMKVILIPPGEFLMGSTDEQVEAAVTPVEAANDRGLQDRVRRTEQPQHKVLITRPFLMSATEVTIGQFKKFSAATGYVTDAERRAAAAKAAPAQAGGKAPLTYLTPGYPVQDDSPAGAISWNDAVAYCEWLTAQDQTLLPLGEGARRADEGPPPGPSPSSGSLRSPPSPGGRRVTYRLPTEAEWEYACRAGTTTLYSFGDDSNELLQYGWHSKNGPHESHPVGTRLPNPFGLFDMHGNLWEWCGDWSNPKWYETSGSPSGLSVDPVGPPTGTRRVLRGGSHNYSATYARSAYRDENEVSDGNAYYGFRVVVELPAPLSAAGPAATGTALTPYEILTSPDYEWTPPENLGPAVNTQHAQGYPALSADGLRLIYHCFSKGGGSLCEATRSSVAQPFGPGVPLGSEFGENSAGFGTALSGDGLTLLFGSPRPGGPRGESSINLWQATRPTPASPFAKPACLTTLSSAELDGAPSVSSDGLTVWFRSDRPKSLSRQGGYWTSRRASLAVEFEPPAPFELPLVPGANGYGHVAGIAISADQRVLLFSPKMDGVVEHDLYLSARPTPQEPFGAPVNLGPAINSATMDVQPTLSADGTILVFSSNRPGGVGEYDLWMTRRVRKATPSVGDYALDFDGVDDLVRIQNYQYVAPSPLTFEAVVAARPPRSQVDALIFAAGSGSNGPRLVCSSRSWSFIYPASPANGSVYAGSDSPVEFGSAVHLAGVWDGREVRLYVDGKKQRQTATPTLRPLDPASVVLGRIGGGGIHGRLQEVRISKVARYTTDFVPDHRFDADDDTEVLYHFDEGAGDVLHDASGNGHDGRIVGATWVRADGSVIVPSAPPAAAGPVATGPALSPSEILTSPDYEWSVPELVSKSANMPTVSGDGLCRVCASDAGRTIGGVDLWLAQRNSLTEPFGTEVNLGPQVNSAEDDAYPWLSADGLTLLFGSYKRPGGLDGYDLWLTTRSSRAEPFGPATPLAAPINSKSQDLSGAMSADGRRIVFSSSRNSANANSAGDLDLFESRRKDSQSPFEPPVKLGAAVNSPLAELRPWLSGDGRVLLFYTAEPKTVAVGSRQIWMAVRSNQDAPFGPRQLISLPSGTGDDAAGFPSLSSDGSLLFFERKQRGADHELWMTRRVPKAAAGPPATGPALAPSTPPPVTLPGVDPVRQAVEYLLSRQVRIDALVAGRRINLKPGDAVPPGPIEVSGVHLNGQASYNRDDFAWLPRLPGLQALFVNSTSFDDACLAYLDGQTKIVTVWVDQTRLSPAGHTELVRKLPALKSINLGGPGCTDETLAALHAATQLKYLEFMSPSAITPAGYLALRRALPGCNIKPHVPSMPPADFPTGPLPAASPASPPAAAGPAATGPAGTAPKQLAYLDPAFQAWVEATRKLPAEQQLEEVSKKLMELNPGFDGQLLAADLAAAPKINNNTVISLGLVSDAVTDLSPLRALKGLVYFACHGTKFGGGKLADLAPLEGLPLESFITQDTRIADLSPLATCKSLRLVKLSSTHATAEQVDRLRAALPKCDVKWDGRTDAPAAERRIAEWALERRWGLQIMIDRVPQVITDRGQLPPEPFWVNSLSMHVSAQDADLARLAPCIGLTHVNVVEAPISDAGLAHLKDAKSLVRLSLAGTRVTDAGLAHLTGLSKLVDLDLRRTRVTPAGVAALQKALRGCKILWDGSAER